MSDLEKYYEQKKRQEELEHRDVLLAISALIVTKDGQTLFSYLFKNLEVATLPDNLKKGEELHECLGFLRAGNSIYKLACESSSEQAAQILAKLERKRYEDLREQWNRENGYHADTSDSED